MDKIGILFLIGREGVIASGAADDAICLFVESKEKVGCCISLSLHIHLCSCSCMCVSLRIKVLFGPYISPKMLYFLPCT